MSPSAEADAAAAAAAAAALARVCPGAAFPLLLPCDASLRAWGGHVAVRDAAGSTLHLALRLEGLPGSACRTTADSAAAGGARLGEGAALVAGAELASLLGPEAVQALQARLRCARSCAAFLVELREAAAAALAARPAQAAPPAPFFAALAAQLASLPPGSLAEAAPDLSRLRLRFADASGREHSLRVALPPGFPAHAPALQADLPLPLRLPRGRDRSGAGGTHLADALAAAADVAARCGWLWAALDALDAAAWALEPEAPAPRAALYRRLALGGAAALWVQLDAGADVATLPPPSLRVYGPEHGAAPRRAKLAAALAAWTPPDASALATGTWLPAWLRQALGEPLPQPPGAASAGGAADGDDGAHAPPECGICYSFAWPGAAEGERGAPPGLGCENPRCGRPFHAQCLSEWLRAQAGGAEGGRAAFGTLFGECPYCGAPIAVPPDAA